MEEWNVNATAFAADDEEVQTVRSAIDTGHFERCKQFAPVAGEQCINGQLVRQGTKIVIPSKLRLQVLALAHEAHLGVVGTKKNL